MSFGFIIQVWNQFQQNFKQAVQLGKSFNIGAESFCKESSQIKGRKKKKKSSQILDFLASEGSSLKFRVETKRPRSDRKKEKIFFFYWKKGGGKNKRKKKKESTNLRCYAPCQSFLRRGLNISQCNRQKLSEEPIFASFEFCVLVEIGTKAGRQAIKINFLHHFFQFRFVHVR